MQVELKDMDETELYFEELLRARGITKSKFARMMNIDRQTMNKLFATMAPEYIRIILPYRGFEEHFQVECMGEVIDDPDEVCKLAMYNQMCDQFDITINLKTKRLTKWIYAVDFRLRANMQGRGTYILMDKDMAPIIQMSSCADFDSIDFVIDNDGVITNWRSDLDFSIFLSEGTIPDDAGVGNWGLATRILCGIYDTNMILMRYERR